VGEGIADLDRVDPRFQPGTRNIHPLLASFYEALEAEDDPRERAYPCNLRIIRELKTVLNRNRSHQYATRNAYIIDLCIVGFYWILRPAEYTYSDSPVTRTQCFKFQDIYLTIASKVYCGPQATPLNDVNNILAISHATLTFTDQKNCNRGEQIGHRANSDPFFCPAKALGRIALHLRNAGAPPDHPICDYYNPTLQDWQHIRPLHITNALRNAAANLEALTGIEPKLLSARSLRPGGATALLCANIDPNYVALLGRWRSNAMLTYLRTQAGSYHLHYSQRMLEHGDYTFAPGRHAALELPQQAPTDAEALLDHLELYR
jgi:hypothetical protein